MALCVTKYALNSKPKVARKFARAGPGTRPAVLSLHAILHVRKSHAMKQKMNRDVGIGGCTKEQRSMVDL